MSDLIDKFFRKAKISYETNDTIGKVFKFFLSSHLWYYPSILFIKQQIKRNKFRVMTIMIETTNRCNSRCIMCPMGVMKRKKGVMDKNLFNLVLERIKEGHLKVDMVWLSGFGEPFLDPNIFPRIKILKNLGYRVKLSTNGSLLNEKNRRYLLDSGIDEVNISFNGETKIDYEKTMLHLKYNQTIGNIFNLLSLRKKMGLKKPLVRISSVLLGGNTSMVGHLKKWRGLADSVSVARAHEWGGALRLVSERKKSQRRFIWPCSSLWNSLYIAWNGDVYPCCVDYDGRMKLGNLKDLPIKDILEGQTLRKIRDEHLALEFKKLPAVCKGCNEPFRQGFDWFLPSV